MRKALKVARYVLTGVVVLTGGAAIWFFTSFPKVEPAGAVAVDPTPALLARGEYLFHHVTVCAACHSLHDETLAGGPERPGTAGQGGAPFPLGGKSVVYARNITPTALGDWTDGELVRSLRDGISRDGAPLFPIMPYTNYRHLARPDLEALIAYTRTLVPRPDEVPERTLGFPLNLLIRIMPSPGGPIPDAADPVAYGEYLVTAASCGECHTPRDDRGQPVPGRTLAGGSEFPLGEVLVRSANITPDMETGIGGWTRERFVQQFKIRQRDVLEPRPLAPGETPSPMPWLAYGGMTEEDLGAIYDYLRTVEPVHHPVVRAGRAEPDSE